ncbi:MAG: polysaccharide biosynthesis tyrosine autokinase [Planctomycetes bacterium]|nr:polysaccharide biosynthesis tyrosine autokinase [Planctomycetota bacterium]
MAISETELDALADLDALALQFDQRKDYLEAWIQQMKDLITDKYLEENPTLLMGPERELSDVERQLAERRAALKQEMQRRRQTEIETKTAEFQAQIASLQEQLGELDTDIAKQEELIEKLFGPDASDSLDSEMMQAEIKWKDSVFAEIAAERHRVQVELERHQSRIAVPQRAIAPKSPDETARVPLLIMAMIGGFLLPVVCITWWDTRGKRINSPLEISDGLGLNVIGSVPVIPARAIGNLNGPSKRHRQWRARLDESVNGIVATLLRKAELEKLRVVLVTSAMSGEGKTTLATHLALSLARTGKRTVLVDFDLRRPALDGVFGVPLQPGVSEVLSGSCDLADLVQPTETENLSLVTAGRIDARVMASLAGGAPGVLFQRLRAEYDFVVVDGSPVLPVVDARYVGQHADAVILSVLRDVSQAPKVSAAWEILVSLGIHAIGVVVTGSSEEAYYRKSGYEQTIPA